MDSASRAAALDSVEPISELEREMRSSDAAAYGAWRRERDGDARCGADVLHGEGLPVGKTIGRVRSSYPHPSLRVERPATLGSSGT